ncbi:TIGR04283 family arsenosugar biosynthesis glycosyltransferase [Clostridioides mangenotii]|uniref:TIGR04283 family arsenosugar biosynthesis glycosyltransferase n=1 Tax=Metaclostridioides mangenotii TaxID=1540 RepID=UPI002149D9FA|nr:TIGR04283 family arsenosugar biosynthesis glycosyltransferase [Clostridioides mangenotii]MCR1954482.1 TIGR04283 family arsenosugar biosynthesis glycosyltransferase [Clostridioides mangenotii]
MRFSIIIPVLNEEKNIESIINNIEKIKGDFEVLFVDGGSRDNTVNFIGDRYKVVTSDRGRAKQMNYGVRESIGEVLLFLHCDSILPEGALEDIEQVLGKGHKVGCFRVKFDCNKPLMKCCGFMSNVRVKYRQLVFGDQGMFIFREDFYKLGGFTDIPIMEDYKFSMEAKKFYSIGQTKSYIITSSRRFIDKGIVKTMWSMQKFQWMFRNGEDIDKIASIYKDIR